MPFPKSKVVQSNCSQKLRFIWEAFSFMNLLAAENTVFLDTQAGMSERDCKPFSFLFPILFFRSYSKT